MRYLSIDIETTGVEPENDQILSVGVILEDTTKKLPFHQIPKLHIAILRDRISGSPYAINMNADLIETINSYQTAVDQDEKNDMVNFTGMQFMKEDEVAEAIFYFLYINGISSERPETINVGQHVKLIGGKTVPVINLRTKPVIVTVAGKNVGTFDKLFLERLPNWKRLIRIQQRVIDPAVLFVDWANDESLPNLPTCKSRAGFPEIVTHDAVEDAWDVIELLRKQY
jgi:oligoribonuclease